MIKRFVALLLALFFMIGACGCMDILLKNDEAFQGEMLDYLKDKYNGQKFIPLSTERGSQDILHCYPEGGDPVTDNVTLQRTFENGETKYRDTYFGVIIRESLENEIMSACSTLALPIRVYFNSNLFYFDNEFDSSKDYLDLKEWFEAGHSWQWIFTIVISSDSVADTEIHTSKITENLKNNGINGLFYIYFVPNDIYITIARTNLNEIIRQNNESIILVEKNID